MTPADVATWSSLVLSIAAIALSYYFYLQSTTETEKLRLLSVELKSLVGEMNAKTADLKTLLGEMTKQVEVVNRYSNRLLDMIDKQLDYRAGTQQGAGKQEQEPARPDPKDHRPPPPKLTKQDRDLQNAIMTVLVDTQEGILLKALFLNDRVFPLVRDAEDVVKAVRFLAERGVVVADGLAPESTVRLSGADAAAGR